MPTFAASWQDTNFQTLKENASADTKGRVALGKNVAANKRYRAYMNEHGQILLDPILEVSEREFHLLADPVKLEAWKKANEDVEHGRLQEKGTFSS